MSELQIIFMGTAQLSCSSLEALVKQPTFRVVAVVTQPDRPKGRDLKVQPSPVKELALRHGLPVLQPENARDEMFIAELGRLAPDLIVVVAYGHILPTDILELPRFGCINVHASLLPKYRGAAPIQWAILNDESEMGVTIMKLDAGLDTGDILAQRRTPIHLADDSETLHDRLAQMGADLLMETILDFIARRIEPRPQPKEGASYAPKIKREDGRVDWKQPARAIWNRVRAFTPWPGAFTHLADKAQTHLLKICQAEVVEGATGQPGEILQAGKAGIVVGCGKGALRILQVQLEGGRRMSAHEFLAGHELRPGQHLA